ncbi:MAG: pyruvate dehydrogenase (acetyl-transferring), homodimeric type [Thermoleophilia bacterium]|jgi:pyruvate dehydrogenase E1 component
MTEDELRSARAMVARVDIDPDETQEWLDALQAVIEHDGAERATHILGRLLDDARRQGAPTPAVVSTPYVNTIPVEDEVPIPGDQEIEHNIRSAIRWNALAMVVRANKRSSGIGGHIASFASAATLYEVGFNHFWHGRTDDHGGDLIYLQGHSSPGFYARAFLEGRLDEEHLVNFRHEVAPGGLSSYPHPWLMPDFWQFPTVSMGLGPLMAIYQARFMKYLHGRGLQDTSDRHVWAFMGDGEMDEPEAKGALALAGEEQLDNLIFVINCNLQRLDGPVRGNSKIIQELETSFRGAGWNVIKAIWGRRWDPLLEADENGLLRQRMEEVVDGEYQTYKSRGGEYVREHFFGANEELKAMVAHMSDEELRALNRGGHDPHKIYAAYHAAVNHTGQPTVILAKTVKGYGMGMGSGEGQNATHQLKTMSGEALMRFRDRFGVPLSDEEAAEAAFFRFPEDSPEAKYLHERRAALGGWLPARVASAPALPIPPLADFQSQLESTGEREISTTMAFVRVLSTLLRNKEVGPHVVPIVADESRTFGMEGLFRQIGIYSHLGQLYEPEDSAQLAFYREDVKGQVLQEGITEAGALSSLIAAGTSYANHGLQMIPFFIFYSMFGFQRVGDLTWAAADNRTRGFLLGGTSGRTTLNGEGLQHEDGHSHVLASVVPRCVAYDPTYAHEVAVIIHDGLRRMYGEQEDVYFYITLLNENYSQPGLREGDEEGILRGMYLLREGEGSGPRVQLMGSGSILREVLAAADLLRDDFGVVADVWSATSFTELRREGMAVERWNRLHPTEEPRRSYVERMLADRDGPVIAATDYIRTFPDQIRPHVRGDFHVLGTDGFGRSDERSTLRRFFEVDRHNVAVTALWALAEDGTLDPAVAAGAITRYDIDPDAEAPWLR